MLLDTLLRAVPQARRADEAHIEIVDIAYDSRTVRPGSLFVAVPTVGEGAESGGYRFLDDAVRLGAVAVVTESERDSGAVTDDPCA